MLFWGMSFVWTKIVFEFYGPITTVLLRLVISSVILFIVLKLIGLLQPISQKHFKLFMLSALFEPLLYFLGENFGLQEVSSTIASVIIATIPVITPIFATFLLKEKITKFNILGIVISFIGIIIMVIDKNLNFTASPKGIALLFVAVFSTIGYAITIKKLAAIYNSATIITYQNIIGIIYFLPLFFIFDFKEFLIIRPSFKALTALFQLAIFASSLAFICYIHVVSKIGVSRANIFTNLIPIVTAVFSYYLLDEKFYFIKVLGIIIVIGGVFLSQIGKIMIRVNNAKSLKTKN
jgi:drug/metabolite transporter (DMT)-like permease